MIFPNVLRDSHISLRWQIVKFYHYYREEYGPPTSEERQQGTVLQFPEGHKLHGKELPRIPPALAISPKVTPETLMEFLQYQFVDICDIDGNKSKTRSADGKVSDCACVVAYFHLFLVMTFVQN